MILDKIAEMLERCDANDVPEDVEAFAAENNVVIVLGAGYSHLFFRGAIRRDVDVQDCLVAYVSQLGDRLCMRGPGPCLCCRFKDMAVDVLKADYNDCSCEWEFATKLKHHKVSVTSQEEGTLHGIAYVLTDGGVS